MWRAKTYDETRMRLNWDRPGSGCITARRSSYLQPPGVNQRPNCAGVQEGTDERWREEEDDDEGWLRGEVDAAVVVVNVITVWDIQSNGENKRFHLNSEWSGSVSTSPSTRTTFITFSFNVDRAPSSGLDLKSKRERESVGASQSYRRKSSNPGTPMSTWLRPSLSLSSLDR